MLVRDFILEAFKEYGVEYIFGNPGTTELPLMDGLVNFPELKYIVGLHEDICVGMAAGYAQATGKPGVANLHASPGLAHGLCNIYNSFREGIPLIVTAGQQDRRLHVQEPGLAGDMVSMTKNFTKWSWEVNTAEELPVVLQRAFKVATTEPMGPVFVSFPSDLMWEQISKPIIPITNMNHELRGDKKRIKKVAEMIKNAKKPVFVSGDRVGRTNSVDALVTLAELTGVKVYGELSHGELNFPFNHPQYLGRLLPNGPIIQEAFAEADLVVYIGVISQAPLLYFDQSLVKEGTKQVFIDLNEWEIGKNTHADMAILGHPLTVLTEITEIIDTTKTSDDEERFIKNHKTTKEAKLKRDQQLQKELKQTAGEVPLSPSQVMNTLNEFLPENALIVDESTTTSRYVVNYLGLQQSKSFIGLKGGGLGFGMPAALGAQLGRKDSRVVSIIGDGSSLYYIQSLWNAAKYNLPVVYVIVNNTSYMVLKGGIMNIQGDAARKKEFIGMDLDDPSIDFIQLAQGFGIDAIRVNTEEELKSAFDNAFSKERPILLDIAIDRTVKVYLK